MPRMDYFDDVQVHNRDDESLMGDSGLVAPLILVRLNTILSTSPR